MPPLPSPPVTTAETMRLPAVVPVGLITASTVLMLIAVALVLGILGVPIERGLGPSDRVQIHGTDLVVTVPEDWTGTETRYLPAPRRPDDPSRAFSQEVWLETGSWTAQVYIHKDPATLREIESRLDSNQRMFQPLSLERTSFEPASWRAWSAESTMVCSVMLIGRQKGAYSRVQVVAIAHQEESTTKPGELLDALEKMVSRDERQQ